MHYVLNKITKNDSSELLLGLTSPSTNGLLVSFLNITVVLFTQTKYMIILTQCYTQQAQVLPHKFTVSCVLMTFKHFTTITVI